MPTLFRDLTLMARRSSYIQYEAGPSPPAAQASVEALPIVKIIEEESECAICLSEFQVGEKAKEMPCKHRYHSNCINQWLEIHGSCPVCRYKMPAAVVTAGRTPTLRESIRRVGSSINELDEEQTDIYIESILGCVFYSVYFGLLYMLSS
ncbi:E3 ubiquitin-protein ligase RNF181-like [Solanum tuberosum]|uniref:RING-type E3 ubiquitin transferase n=1 Tax=Solanum tuberosum TaxID=4113 RepID=M1DZH6_SOLTU|nr:PREDICTED: E3 ubiquitin-protein ligase RNF181-like [Solanum tuberosum]